MTLLSRDKLMIQGVPYLAQTPEEIYNLDETAMELRARLICKYNGKDPDGLLYYTYAGHDSGVTQALVFGDNNLLPQAIKDDTRAGLSRWPDLLIGIVAIGKDAPRAKDPFKWRMFTAIGCTEFKPHE